MRLTALLPLLVCLAAPAEELSEIRAVYVLPMGNGLDQYLANRLTNERVFQVVADPARADAVITDRLGETFEDRMRELYPEKPAGEPAAKQPAAEPKPSAAPAAKTPAGSGTGESHESATGPSPPKIADRPLARSFRRARGTVFVVDAKTRAVVWSAFALPSDSTPEKLDKAARRIVGHLKKDLQKP